MTQHNHVTRDVKLPGKCPACDSYWATMQDPNDQFARDIFMADNSNAKDPAKEWEDATEYDRAYAYGIAAELKKLGYRKTDTDAMEWGVRCEAIGGGVSSRHKSEDAARDVVKHYRLAPKIYGKVELLRRAIPHTWEVVEDAAK